MFFGIEFYSGIQTLSLSIQQNIFLTVPTRQIFKDYFLRWLCIFYSLLALFFSFLQVSLQNDFIVLALYCNEHLCHR